MPDIKLVRLTTVPISLNLLLKGQLKYMSEHGISVHTASADGPEIEEFTVREHVPHRILPLTRRITPLTDMRAVYETYRWFTELKPDIVHTHTPKAGLVGMLAAKLAGVPHRLHTVAGMPLMESSGAKRKILETVEEITYKCATHVYPNSGNLKAFILNNLSVDDDKVQVLGSGSSNGIDSDFFKLSDDIRSKGRSIRATLNIDEKDKVFCFVGRIVRDKGIDELVEAFIKIHEKDRNTHLLLVGPFEPDLDPLTEKTVIAIQSNDCIHTVGFQSDIRPYLAASEIFTFPSYREGFPNVVLQASCMELPVIVTDINGCNEIVTNGENGLIVPTKNADALETAMLRYLNTKELRQIHGQNARLEVVEKYSQQYIWKLLLTEYEQLVSHVPIAH